MDLRYSKEFKATIKLAYPVVIGQLGHLMMGVVDNLMVGRIGAAPLAASSIAHGLFMIFMIFGIGLSMAISPLTAMSVGAKKYEECGIVFRRFLPTFYIDNPAVIEIAASLLVIAALFQLSDGTQAVGIGLLRGLADAKVPMFITFISYWIVGLPGGYLLGFTFNYGVQGIWFALFIALTVSAVLLSVRFMIKSKQKVIL